MVRSRFNILYGCFQGEFTLSIKSYDDDTPNFDVFDLIDESLLTFNTSLIAPTNTTQLQSISGTVTTTNFTIRYKFKNNSVWSLAHTFVFKFV